MSKHTAGPWTVTKHDQHWVRVNVTIKAGGNTWVAFMPDEDKEERLANARLMAGAPALLEALEALLEQTRQYGHTAEIEAAEQAIAKASGTA